MYVFYLRLCLSHSFKTESKIMMNVTFLGEYYIFGGKIYIFSGRDYIFDYATVF